MIKTIVFIVQNGIGFVFGWVVALLVVLPLFFIAALPKSWRFQNRVYYFFLNIFYWGIVKASLVPVQIVGKENIPDNLAIIISNHQSAFDIPLVGSLLGRSPHVWLFLARFERIPIFGFITRRMNITVDHKGLRKLVGSLHETLNVVNEYKSHIVMFPEGGRYTDGTIHKFFYGFAILAKATNRPIVPVILYGPGKVLPPRTFLLRMHAVKVIIGKPVYFDPSTSEDEIVQYMYTWFVENYQEKV